MSLLDRSVDAPPAPSAGGKPRKTPRRWGPVIRTVIGWLLVLLAWELLARATDGTRLIASPIGMVQAMIENVGLYWRGLTTTMYEAALGFLFGNLAAILLATLVALTPLVERMTLRLALILWCLPLVATGPLLRLVFGFGDVPQITLAAQAVFYTTLVPLLVGLRAVPAGWLDLVGSYGRGRLTTLRVVRARASLPYLATGLQVAVPAAFLGALVGEFTGAERGIGILTIQALRSLDTDGLWALAAISAFVSVIGYVVVGLLARWLSIGQPELLLTPPKSSGPRRSWPYRIVRAVIAAVATVGIVLGAWWLAFRLLDLNPYFAKGPSDVWAWMVSGPMAEAHRNEIFSAMWSTILVAVPGYLAGLLLGAGLASVFELMPSVRRTATPVAVALRCVPIFAIAPLLVQALGRGVFGTTVVVALMTFFPTLVACSYGLRQAPGQVVDFFDTFDTPQWRTLLLARLPAMAPAFFSAARIAAPSAILAATVAEWLATGTGMGWLISLAAGTSVYGTLWASVVVITAVSVAFYGVISLVERIVLARLAPEQGGW